MLLLSAFNSIKFCLEIGDFDQITIRRFYRPFVKVLACFVLMFSVVKVEAQVEEFCKYIVKNETQMNGSSESFEKRFGYGFNIDVFTYAIENKKYFDPKESVI